MPKVEIKGCVFLSFFGSRIICNARARQQKGVCEGEKEGKGIGRAKHASIYGVLNKNKKKNKKNYVQLGKLAYDFPRLFVSSIA